MIIVNDTQLNDILSLAVTSSAMVSGELFFVTSLMFNTGARFEEAHNLHLWNISADRSTVSYNTAKRGNLRTLALSLLPSFCISYIDTGLLYLSQYSYSTCLYHYKQAIAAPGLKTEGKYLHLHAFRHNYIRALKADGLTNSQIQFHMALSDIKTVEHYLSAQVTIG